MFNISYSFPEARSLVQQQQNTPLLVLKKGDFEARYVVISSANTLIGKIQNLFKLMIALVSGYRKSSVIELMPGYLFLRQIRAIKQELHNTLLKLNKVSSDLPAYIDDEKKTEIKNTIQNLISSPSHQENFFKNAIQHIYSLGLDLMWNISNVTYIEKNPVRDIYEFMYNSAELIGFKAPNDIDSNALKARLNSMRAKYANNLRNALIDPDMTHEEYNTFCLAANAVSSFATNPYKIVADEISILVSFLSRISIIDALPILSIIETRYSLQSLMY